MKRSVLFLSLALAGCAVTNHQPPLVSDLSSSGISPTKLDEGRTIFTRNCTACHSARPISEYSTTEWQNIVDEMAPRTKLSDDRKSALVAYLNAARSVASAPAH